MQYTLRSLLGALTLLFFFFHLRVFDEHKDFEEDSRFHPHRVLQRGVITLADLRVLAALCIVAEIGLAAVAGWAALTGLAIVYLAVRSRYLVPLAEALSLSSVRFLSPELCVLMLVGGMAVGCIGGLVAATVRS